MDTPTLHDHVRLTRAIPTLWLDCGDVGIVRSIWLAPSRFYEVEFRKPGDSCAVRALVKAENLQVIESAALAGAAS